MLRPTRVRTREPHVRPAKGREELRDTERHRDSQRVMSLPPSTEASSDAIVSHTSAAQVVHRSEPLLTGPVRESSRSDHHQVIATTSSATTPAAASAGRMQVGVVRGRRVCPLGRIHLLRRLCPRSRFAACS